MEMLALESGARSGFVARSEALRSRRILVLDDEPAIRSVMSAIFQRRGFAVTGCGCCEEAAAELERGEFDLAIVDRDLGCECGWDLLSRLAVGLPVILMSGLGDDDEISAEVQRRGAAAYLSKPMDGPLLVRTVEEVLRCPTSRNS